MVFVFERQGCGWGRQTERQRDRGEREDSMMIVRAHVCVRKKAIICCSFSCVFPSECSNRTLASFNLKEGSKMIKRDRLAYANETRPAHATSIKATPYRCLECNIFFNSPQALGGHKVPFPPFKYFRLYARVFFKLKQSITHSLPSPRTFL